MRVKLVYIYVWRSGKLSFQSSTIGDRMRAFLVLNILVLVLGIGYGFRVNDVLEETQRQTSVNDNIPAVNALLTSRKWWFWLQKLMHQ